MSSVIKPNSSAIDMRASQNLLYSPSNLSQSRTHNYLYADWRFLLTKDWNTYALILLWNFSCTNPPRFFPHPYIYFSRVGIISCPGLIVFFQMEILYYICRIQIFIIQLQYTRNFVLSLRIQM